MSSENERYRAAYSRMVWLDMLQVDFNRPPHINADGDLEYSGRMFAFPDHADNKVGELVIITDYDGALEGTPGTIGRITEVDPEIHCGKREWENWVYVRAKQVDWAVVDRSALHEQ